MVEFENLILLKARRRHFTASIDCITRIGLANFQTDLIFSLHPQIYKKKGWAVIITRTSRKLLFLKPTTLWKTLCSKKGFEKSIKNLHITAALCNSVK